MYYYFNLQILIVIHDVLWFAYFAARVVDIHVALLFTNCTT